MKMLYVNMKYFIFLMFAVLLSACNEEGIATLVLEEDGPHSVAQMIIGQWRVNHAEWADKNGNVIKEPDITNIPELNLDKNGIGYFGNGISNGNSGFNWTINDSENTGTSGEYDDSNPSITFNGERWYIFQLTKSRLILYRMTDKYIIIYYYYRVGDYNGNNEPPVQSVARIHRIKSTTVYNSFASQQSEVYTFKYDDQWRIREYSISKDNNINMFNYRYNGVEEVYVEGDKQYKGLLKEQRLEKLYENSSAAVPFTLVASPMYNEEGYMSSVNDMIFIYDKGNLISIAGSKNMDYSYEYSDLDNNANIDLNSFISNCNKVHRCFLFASFGFCGEFSNNLISKEIWSETADFYFEYTYEKDSDGRISTIIRKSIDKHSGSVLNTTTFEVFYEEETRGNQ